MDYKLPYQWIDYKSLARNPSEETDFLHFYASQLAQAIYSDNAETLKDLLDTYGGIGLIDKWEHTLLFLTLARDSHKAFKLLIETEGVDVDAGDSYQNTPLLYSIKYCKEYMAIELIHKGADIHLVTRSGESALYLAIQRKYLRVAVLLIERGIDIDCCDHYGKTPLAIACEYERVEVVNMLLFHGARADTRLVPICLNMDPHICESISDFIFDEHKDPVSWKIFADACAKYIERKKNQEKSFFFGRFLDSISEITYVDLEVGRLNWRVIFEIEPQHFQTILKKLENDLKYILSQTADGQGGRTIKNAIQLENWTTLLNSKLSSQDVLRNIEFYFCYGPRDSDDFRKKIGNFISLCMTKGVRIPETTVSEAYSNLGYSSLFKIMLRADILTLDHKYLRQDLMPVLIYDVQLTLEEILDEHCLTEYNSSTFDEVLEHFSNPRFNQYCLIYDDSVQKKAKKMPQIPLLAELARNKARKHIIDFFLVKNFRDFDDIVEKLDIAVTYKKMLTYELKLY